MSTGSDGVRRAALVAALFMSLPATPLRAAEAGLELGRYAQVDAFVRRGDADGDGRLAAAERARVETAAEARHGARGLATLRQYVTAADADADGDLTLAEWQALGQRLRQAAGIRRETVRLAMADGTRLATEVWRPWRDGAFPVILQRTPYGRDQGEGPAGLVRQGYAIVVQDMRGRFDSEGDNLPFIGCGWEAHQDGADTVRWLRQQPWCNGRIASQGGSAGGITQNLLAGALGPEEGLACQVIHVAAASLYHHAAYVGGALRQSQIEGWLNGNGFAPEAIRLYRAHPTYDAFWHAFDSSRRHAVMTAPALHIGGWFDTFSLGTVTSFVGRQTAGAPGARGTQRLLMGPWAHGGYRDGGKVGELTFPQAQAPAAYSPSRWFERYLKDGAPEVDTLPAVAYYVMGDVDTPGAPGNLWRQADTWPPPHTPLRLYLAADRSLTPTAPATPPAAAPVPPLAYTFDPASPCPTRGGGNLNLPSGPLDQRPVESRPDVVCFTTAPYREPLEIAGQIQALIYLESDAVDTDLSVRVCDVYPDGRSLLMAEGMLRARYRDGVDQERPLTPGTVYPLAVELWPTSFVLNAGHCLRLTVTSSNHPRFDVNPGTGRPFAAGEPTRPQRNTVHSSPDHPSHLVLPVSTDPVALAAGPGAGGRRP